MKICVIGVGYVGLVTGTCLAELRHDVICVDNNQERIAILNGGKIPFYEPGLLEMVSKNTKLKKLYFTSDIAHGIKGSEVIFIAVGTPAKTDGRSDISAIIKVVQAIAEETKTKKEHVYIVNKSTTPVGTGKMMENIMVKKGIPKNKFTVIANPEFLREGSAISDFMIPDRIIIGASDNRAFSAIAKIYQSLDAQIMFTSIINAELIKYASNAFLATKISFINELASVCAKLDADVNEIAYGVGLDKRIGGDFLKAGLGYGGGCLPKDIAALIHLLKENECQPRVLQAVQAVNTFQIDLFVSKILNVFNDHKDKQIAILGVSFKPGTDDFRNAPSEIIIKRLIAEGIKIKVYDPLVKEKIKAVIPEVQVSKDIYEAVKGVNALAIITECPEFKKIDLEKIKFLMAEPIIFDGRNMFDLKTVREQGFTYIGIGR